jgi:hypothetical protein
MIEKRQYIGSTRGSWSLGTIHTSILKATIILQILKYIYIG